MLLKKLEHTVVISCKIEDEIVDNEHDLCRRWAALIDSMDFSKVELLSKGAGIWAVGSAGKDGKVEIEVEFERETLSIPPRIRADITWDLFTKKWGTITFESSQDFWQRLVPSLPPETT